jgi:hypothetical protein
MYEKLRAHLLRDTPRESAAFVLVGFFVNSRGYHVVARELMFPEEKDYDDRSGYRIQVAPIFFNRVISRAEKEELAVMLCHSHPGDDKPIYSGSDDYGESISAKTLFDCLNGKPTGSLLFGRKGLIGRIWTKPGTKPKTIDQLRIVGRHLRLESLGRVDTAELRIRDDIYSRQLLAFGKKGQQFISSLIIGIVGLGGTGSCIAEQLARLGATSFILVDKDTFEPSNMTRVYGSYSNTRKKSKTSIAKKNIEKIQREATVKEISKDVISQAVLSQLKDCDLVFSCTDAHAPRSVVNELCYQYFIPLIDVGAGLGTDGQRITEASVRATLVSPELPCLFCYGIVRPEIISAELMSPQERERRIEEGYITGYDTNAPSVVSFTTTASAMGVSLFLDALFGYMGNSSANLILDAANFDSHRVAASVGDCVCMKRLARGDYMPFSAP